MAELMVILLISLNLSRSLALFFSRNQPGRMRRDPLDEKGLGQDMGAALRRRKARPAANSTWTFYTNCILKRWRLRKYLFLLVLQKPVSILCSTGWTTFWHLGSRVFLSGTSTLTKRFHDCFNWRSNKICANISYTVDKWQLNSFPLSLKRSECDRNDMPKPDVKTLGYSSAW